MKKILISILALVAVTACNKEEIVDANPGDAIAFGNAFVDNATKADYSSTDITSFNVYGTVNDVNIYNATPVTKGTADYGAVWNCDVKQYWIDGAAYKFAAVVDATSVNVNTTTKMPESLVYDATSQKDMLYKYEERTGKPTGQNSIVAFTFTHLLSKAFFTVTNNIQDSKYTYSITDVKVTNAYQNGTYTVTGDNGTWGGTNANATSFANIESVANGTPKTNAEMLLIPTATVGVSFKVHLYIDGTEVTSYDFAKAEVATLAANSVYNFNVTLSLTDEIQFTVTKQPKWTTPNENVSI